MSKYKIIVGIMIMLLTLSCCSNPDTLSSEKTIITFNFISPNVRGIIDDINHTIILTVPFETDVTSLIPIITQTGSSINPPSEIAQDFTTPLTYTVTAEDLSTQDYIVSLDAYAGTGDVFILLLKNLTEEPVRGASVSVGPSSGVTSYDGNVSINVPVRIDTTTGDSRAERVAVSGRGIDGKTVDPGYITPLVGQTVYQTLYVNALGIKVSGRLQSSEFNSLYLAQNLCNSIIITSAEIPLAYLQPDINVDTGEFSINIPVDASYFYLIFSSPYFESTQIGPIYVGFEGDFSLPQPVTLIPIVRDVEGYIVDSHGTAVSLENGSMTISLGRSADYLNGSFLFRNVPVGLNLTINADTYNGETVTKEFNVPYDGNGYYSLGTLITSP